MPKLSFLDSVPSSLIQAREFHIATLLPSGKALVTGGQNNASGVLASAELYDPATGIWTVTGNMDTARWSHTATLLPNGTVLVAGGAEINAGGGVPASAEIYDLGTGTFTRTGDLVTGRWSDTATLLTTGQVLVAGGYPGFLASAELYDSGD